MKGALSHRLRRLPALAIALLCAQLGAARPALAETLRYAIDLPAGHAVTYAIDVDVRRPGSLAVHAEWSGSRSLSLRLIPPGAARSAVHRAGQSPQRIETRIDDAGKLGPGSWTLRVHSMAADGGGTGLLSIELPGTEPRPDPVREELPRVTDPPGDPSASFAAARSIPRGTPGRFMPFLEATERLRAAIAGDGPVPSPSDVCQWQVGLLRYLDERRDVLLDSGTATSPNTAEVLARMARAAESVEELRVSDDPLVAGPAPRDPRLRDAWRKLRTTRIDPVEAELDRILSMVRGDFAPELAQQIWPARYVSCLTACERYFEQRTRVGEERAHNRELALAQWPTILAATDALAALAELTAATARDTRAGR